MKMMVSLWEGDENPQDIDEIDLVHIMGWPDDEYEFEEAFKESNLPTYTISMSYDGYLRITAEDSYLFKNKRLSINPISDKEIEIRISKGALILPQE